MSAIYRRGCAAFVGRDVSKLKAKGGGKFKYMPEKEMLELAERFRPYRYVHLSSLAPPNLTLAN
jgi:hypothetical protein